MASHRQQSRREVLRDHAERTRRGRTRGRALASGLGTSQPTARRRVVDMRRFAARLLEFLRLTRGDADARREIDAHLALMREDFENRGMSADAARRAARLAFGGIEQTREAHLDARSFSSLETARQD